MASIIATDGPDFIHVATAGVSDFHVTLVGLQAADFVL